MAITNYLRLCDYQIGGLKPFIYLIDKSALKLNIKAKGIEVFFEKRKEGDVKKIDAQLCIYTQEETYSNKFRFNSTLQVTVNEQYEDPFLYGLKDLRLNKYYIIIEDKKGTQYLVNPELFTKFTYEYTFVDGGDNYNSVVLTFVNLSNFPLLIFKEKIESNILLFGKKCDYNLAKTVSLVMAHYEDLKVNDDGVKCDEIYVDDIEYLKKVEFMKETFNLKETFDGSRFKIEMSFSIPLSNHQFEWAYDLIEFQKNKYKALIHTTNNNYILVGNEKGLFPSYTIQTSEEDETPNLITFKFTHMSQYPVVFTDEIHQYRWVEDEPLCFGFDKYQMLRQQITKDWGQNWEDVQPIVKKKGELIEANSEDCKEYRWIDDITYCAVIGNEYNKWIIVDGFVCENGNKYQKLQKYYSTDNQHYVAQEEYAKGSLIESKSQECMYIAVRWVEDDKYMCYEVNEELTRWVETENACIGTDLYKSEIEEVTSNGIVYHPSGEYRNSVLVEENCCECGYREKEYRKSDRTICGSEIKEATSGMTIPITKYEGNWIVDGNTFQPSYRASSTETIYFKSAKSLEISFLQKYDDFGYISKLDTEINIVDDSTFTSIDNKLSGTIKIDVPDTNEHFIQLKFAVGYGDRPSSYELCKFTINGEFSFENTSLYEIWEEWEFCPKDPQYDVKTGNIDYRNPQPNCDCGFTGNSFVFDGETICGSDLGEGYDENKYYEIWAEKNVCTLEPTGNVEYRNPKDRYEYKFTEEYICGSELGETYEKTYKYEIWKKYDYCTQTFGDETQYKNPKPSYDCGLITYEWRLESNNICGSALPDNTVEVDTPPTNN